MKQSSFKPPRQFLDIVGIEIDAERALARNKPVLRRFGQMDLGAALVVKHQVVAVVDGIGMPSEPQQTIELLAGNKEALPGMTATPRLFSIMAAPQKAGTTPARRGTAHGF